MTIMIKRCDWVGTDPAYIEYHDEEWGVQVHDDYKIFEFLLLEGMQAGLSWITVLKKRDNFRKAFDNFDPEVIAKYSRRKVDLLMMDHGIIRNRQKIESALSNARAFLEVRREFGSFDSYIWDFVDRMQIKNRWKRVSNIPSRSVESERLSRDLIRRGFKFVGPVICYSHMQATGMVNDHITSCFRYDKV